MSDLNEIVDLSTFRDDCRAKGSTIDTGARPDLNVALNNDVAYLRNLAKPLGWVGCIPKPVRPDNRVVMNDRPRSDNGVSTDRDTRINSHAIQNGNVFVDSNVRMKD